MLRQNFGRQSSDAQLRRRETWLFNFFDKTRLRCEKAFRRVKVSDIIADEEPWHYLDLASKHTIGRHWGRQVLMQIAQEMPQECKEFFTAEKEYWTMGMPGTLYFNITTLYLEGIESYHMDFRSFYLPFESVFFRRIDRVQNRELRMKKIKKFLNVYKLCEPRRVSIFESLLELCTDPPLSSDLTMDVLQTLFEEQPSRMFLFELVPDENALEVMLWHAKQARFDFWGLWQGRGGMSENLNPIADYIGSHYRNSFARVLLKYGFKYSSSKTVCIKHCYKFLSYRYPNFTIGKAEGLAWLMKTNNFLRTMLLVDIFHTFANPEGYNDVQDKTITLVHLTRTLSEPYVTQKELYDTLSRAVVCPFKEDLEKICEVYQEADVFDEDYTVLHPRRLMHLCRCRIRDILADKMMLPEGIRQLNLPLTIEMYLELKF